MEKTIDVKKDRFNGYSSKLIVNIEEEKADKTIIISKLLIKIIPFLFFFFSILTIFFLVFGCIVNIKEFITNIYYYCAVIFFILGSILGVVSTYFTLFKEDDINKKIQTIQIINQIKQMLEDESRIPFFKLNFNAKYNKIYYYNSEEKKVEINLQEYAQSFIWDEDYTKIDISNNEINIYHPNLPLSIFCYF